MLLKGVELLVVGMTAVFLFLALLVLLMRLMRHGLNLFGRFSEEQEEVITTSIQRVMGKNDDIAVAIAAVKAFTKK